MEFVNKNLLLSLKQDLKSLSATSSEILQSLRSFELNSWLFPTKSYKQVSEIDLTIIPEDRQYLFLLELTIDKLYVVINQIVRYLEDLPNLPEQRHTPKNIIRPNNFSLGASTQLLWKKICSLKYFTVKDAGGTILNKEFKGSASFSNTDTQTDFSHSNMCNSCCEATSCVKTLVNLLTTHAEAVSSQGIWDDIQENIYDITQYGCMYRLTSAITEDIKTFIERSLNLKKQNKQYVDELQNVTLKYSESLRIIESLDSLYKKTKTRCRKAKRRNGILVKKINELSQLTIEKEKKIQVTNENVKTLENAIREATKNVTLLSFENKNLHENSERVMSESLNSLFERDTWKKRFTETYLENRRLKSEMDEYHSEIVNMKNSMNMISSYCDRLSEKLEISNVKILKKTTLLENVIKSTRIRDVETNKITNTDAAVTYNNSLFNPKIRVKGDPVTDMKQQIEANLFNIKKLEQYNSDLLRTIYRIQEKAIAN